MNVGKFFCKFFGGILLNLSLTVFILSFFAGYSIANIDVFEDSLKSMVGKDVVLRDYNETEKEQIEEFCKLNPDYEGCDLINEPESVESEEFRDFVNKIKSYNTTILIVRVLCIFLFFIGVLLLYLAHLSFIATLYKVSLAGLFTSGFAIVYYKFLPAILRGIFNGEYIRSIASDLPSDVLDKLINVILDWLTMPLNRTLNLSIILTVIFLILTVIFYIAKKKVLNKNNLKGNSNGKKQKTANT